jgi:demethylmenaquinone methyltransferase / 2-methoxy-6-polyprenyl-1,4-benzoquinol methylase
MEAADADTNAAHFDPEADDVFGRIAGRYDRLCDVFSVFAHRLWKARIARRISQERGDLALDVASGTGDIPLRLLRRASRASGPKRILVTDISPQMLAQAEKKLAGLAPVEYRRLDAHALDLPDASVDTYSISFGMKICDRARVMGEAFRVLRPGGVFYCLEAARIPIEPLHRAYLLYMDWCLPLIARIATGGDASAYNYLLRGVHDFPRQREFASELAAIGFEDITFENLTLGIVAIHRGVKPLSPLASTTRH